MSPETSGALRHVITAIGAAMAAMGWIAPESVEAFVGNTMGVIVPFVGVAVAAVPFYFSWRAKKATSDEAKKIAAKVEVAGVPITAEVRAEKAK